MIIVALQGGLGNQMFQYASARGMAKRNKPVYFDLRLFEENDTDKEHFTARKYQLGIFKNLRAQKATNYQLNFFKSPALCFKVLRFLIKAKIIQQRENEYISLNKGWKPANIYMNGYFQSEKYFKHIREQLLTELNFPPLGNEIIKNRILNARNSVSIHVRRGDYLKSPVIFDVHGILPLNYYQQAADILRSKYQSLSLFIFSDDINWCKSNLKLPGSDIYFVTGNNAQDSWKDMALMNLCTHHIIANSSFSWWGAWLSVKNGDVFAPSRWFNPLKVNFDIHDFIPDNWTILNVE